MDLRAVHGSYLIAVVLYFGSFASPASAACTYLQYTSEKCRSAGHIWIAYPASRSVRKGSSVQANLPYSVNQIYWYCGSSRERTPWGKMVNRLDVSFLRDGTIHFWAYKCTRCTFVGRTYDYCRGSHYIKVQGQTIYKNSYNRVVKLPRLQRQVFWYCGRSSERAAWGNDANELSIKYFIDGRIEWNAYKCS